MAARDISPSRTTSSRPSAAQFLASLAGLGLFDLLAPGLYAWGITVAWPASQRLAPSSARLLAGAALVSLLAGTVLTRFSPSAARLAGIWLFLASCLGAWAVLARSIAPAHLDPVHGLLGSVGWAAFAIVWGGERPSPDDPDAEEAPLRAPPWSDARRRTTLIMAVVAVAAAIPMIFAWWVVSIERALLAHAVSLAAAIALIASAVDLAAPYSRESGPRPPVERPQKRLMSAAWPLTVLAGLALAGALIALVR